MKKILEIKLVLSVMMLSLLCGCGGNNSNETNLPLENETEDQSLEAVAEDVFVELGDGVVIQRQKVIIKSEDASMENSDAEDEDLEAAAIPIDYDVKYYDNDEDIILTDEQLDLLKAYMDRYYASLASLELYDMSDLFTNTKGTKMSNSNIEFQIGLRKMTEGADYSLNYYNYVLDCADVGLDEDGNIIIRAYEDSIQVFAQTPDVESKKYGDPHIFVLKEKNGKWYIKDHAQYDRVYMIMDVSDYDWTLDNNEEYMTLMPEYLELIEETTKARANIKVANETVKNELEAENEYDRDAALEYAASYINKRNPQWWDYSDVGGNCQNFASQCLYAGGIPMDTVGHVWKWYSERVSNGGGRYGRSSSWTSVDFFVEYVKLNSGAGLVAQVSDDYMSGIPGDLVIIGTEGDWRHTIIVSDIVTDDEGNPVDYLVYSNTCELENYPVSLYGYPEAILVEIIGWN